MEDREIEQRIITMLQGTSYVLVSFERWHGCFGNMIAIINNLKNRKKYRFTSDRGDIYCDQDLIYTSDYHVAGEDDSVTFFLNAIELTTSMSSVESTVPFHSTKRAKIKEDIIAAHRYSSNHMKGMASSSTIVISTWKEKEQSYRH